jgi:hypothetical protein
MLKMRKFIEQLETYHLKTCRDEMRQSQGGDDRTSHTTKVQLDDILASMYMTTSQLESLFFELEKQQDQEALDSHTEKDDYILEDEIRYVVEQISLVSLSNESEIIISGSGNVPERASGNIKNLRLCLHSALDFATKYQQRGNIQINAKFEGKSEGDPEEFTIGFEVVMERTPELDGDLQTLEKCHQMEMYTSILQNKSFV